jgi:hypothetical protein
MQKLLIPIFLLIGFAMHSQIKGKITSSTGEGIPFVSVTIENTYNSTTANVDGEYELSIKAAGKHTLLFHSIGYKAKKATVNADKFPYIFNVVLEDENYNLKELVISNKEDPAYAIIREAIAHRKENGTKSGRFEADFYSKGMYRVTNVPDKIMGIKVDTGDDILDASRSGIIYLAETVSHITADYPNKIKERIIATKVSGNDNGFSYNTARENNFNFYSDYINYEEIDLISPIAKGALGYYKYKFMGSTFDDNGNQIHKIQVMARRDKEPVFDGFIYIVEGSWAIYGTDLNVKGYRIQQPIMKNFNVQQNFSYNQTNGIWAKNSQILEFSAGAFGMTFTGKYTHVYSNYIFHETLAADTFGKEIAIIEENSAKKDTVYWNIVRPVPLSKDEIRDYTKKDSIMAIKKSVTYTDSIRNKANKFNVFDIVSGYSYRKNEPGKSVTFTYDGIMDKISYNTVQGWNTGTTISLNTYNNEKKRFFSGSATFNYGIAEKRLRVSGKFSRTIKKVGTFYFSGGNTIEQFNPGIPITPFINAVSTLFFEHNYMKLYDNTFAKVSYGRTVFDFLSLNGNVEYLRRRPLYNNADWVFISKDHSYTSNNPLEPYNYNSAPFVKHDLVKATIGGSILFKRKYITYHNFKSPIYGENYPEISFQYQKAFGSSEKQYEYDFISTQASYKFAINNKGDFGISLKAGKFFNADGIAFMDYKHFNGNQTHIGTKKSYLDVFNLLPYYSHSTNDAYLETHMEHNFKGYIMNKIPLLNALQWNLIVGYHSIASPDYKPYHEFTAGFDNIGIGPFRFLRVDYVRSYQSGFKTDGIVLGLHFFLD